MSAIPEVVFVLGPPGAGKGTQCARIKDTFGFIHLSAGDLLRAEQAAGSPDGDLIARYIKEGEIVPIEITVRLLEKAITSTGATKVLIDGFPRNKDNLDGWNKDMTGKVRTKFMLYFQCDEDKCLERVMNRNQNRADDNVESFKKRITTYTNSTVPILAEFESLGLLKTVSANGDQDEVWTATRVLFEESTIPPRPVSDLPLPPLPTPPPILPILAPALHSSTPVPHSEHSCCEGDHTVVTLGSGGEQEEGGVEGEYGGIFAMCNLL